MRLTTTARHFEITPDIVEYLEEKMFKLKRFFDNILHVNVIMSVEKFRHIAEVSIHVNGHNFFAKEESDDMKMSIEKVAENLERQIKKFKGKKVSNHRKAQKQEVYVMPEEKVIDSKSIGKDSNLDFIERAEKKVPLYSVEEAILDMEDAVKHFVLFNNRESGKLSLVYRRDDGNYGLIEKFN